MSTAWDILSFAKTHERTRTPQSFRSLQQQVNRLWQHAAAIDIESGIGTSGDRIQSETYPHDDYRAWAMFGVAAIWGGRHHILENVDLVTSMHSGDAIEGLVGAVRAGEYVRADSARWVSDAMPVAVDAARAVLAQSPLTLDSIAAGLIVGGVALGFPVVRPVAAGSEAALSGAVEALVGTVHLLVIENYELRQWLDDLEHDVRTARAETAELRLQVGHLQLLMEQIEHDVEALRIQHARGDFNRGRLTASVTRILGGGQLLREALAGVLAGIVLFGLSPAPGPDVDVIVDSITVLCNDVTGELGDQAGR